MTAECNQVTQTKNGTHVTFIAENKTTVSINFPLGVKTDKEYEAGSTYEINFSVK